MHFSPSTSRALLEDDAIGKTSGSTKAIGSFTDEIFLGFEWVVAFGIWT